MRLNSRKRRATVIGALLVLGVIAAAVLLPGRMPGSEIPTGVRAADDGMGESASSASCRTSAFEVEIPDLGGEPQQVLGQFCTPDELNDATPVQVLLHGGAYDHHYWDWPYQPARYSYVQHATQAGYATLNLDRLGYGASSRPDPELLDFDIGALAVHQVVEELRTGALGPAFETVILNGHSMGGLVAERAAAHGGVDAVIVSGIAPDDTETDEAERGNGSQNSEGTEEEEDGPPADGDGPPSGGELPFHPAQDDPRFANEPWAEGYLTTVPGARDEAFLYPGAYDPAVLEFEESLKDTLAGAEIRSVQSDDEQPDNQEVPEPNTELPVAYVLGEHDTIACDESDCRNDPEALGADYIVPGSVHSINVSYGATDFYAWTFEWLRELDLAG